MENFSDWLQNQLDERGWKQADLARASKLDTAVISNVINQRRKAGEVVCRAIAAAFNMSPETVFRAAGILPPPPPILEETQARLTVIGQRLAELKRSLDRLTDAILDAGHSPQLITRLKSLETEQAKLQAEQTALHATLTDLTTRPTDEQLERMIRQLGPALETGEPALVRSIILRLIGRITAERLDDTIVANVIYILPTGISHRGGSRRRQIFSIRQYFSHSIPCPPED